MSHRTRREFLTTTGSGIAASLLLPTLKRGRNQPGPPAGRTRKNVMNAAAKGDLASLSKGVAELRKLATTKPSDPRGWILQAFIHGDCNQFTKCQHGNWFFAPWHRSFLYYFEQLIQHFSENADFALPYWDWSRTHGVPPSFYGTGNPLNDTLSISSSCSDAPSPGRGRTVNDQFSQGDLNTFVGPTAINTMQQNPDFATYGGSDSGAGRLEVTPHNFIHRWVGGSKGSNMVQFFSPLDPIFWLHHCNLDRLYSNWLARPLHNPPSDQDWQQTSFNDFFDKDGNPVGSEFTCGATVDSTVMGYTYDETADVPTHLTNALQPPASPPQVLGSVTASKASAQTGVLTFVSDAAPGPELRISMNATALGASEYVVRLRIEGVKTPPRQNTAVHVFLGRNITVNTPTSAPGYVGTFTFFDGSNPAASGHQHRNILLNASDALQRLYGDISLPQNQNLAVSIVTRPLYTGVQAFATIEEIQPDRIHFDVVRLRG
jgi:tyrosinase